MSTSTRRTAVLADLAALESATAARDRPGWAQRWEHLAALGQEIRAAAKVDDPVATIGDGRGPWRGPLELDEFSYEVAFWRGPVAPAPDYASVVQITRWAAYGETFREFFALSPALLARLEAACACTSPRCGS